jgi:hypothetical protein
MQNRAFEWINVFVYFTESLYATVRFYNCRSEDSDMNLEVTLSLLWGLFFLPSLRKCQGSDEHLLLYPYILVTYIHLPTSFDLV